jgi:protein-tyrosine-phosphatase
MKPEATVAFVCSANLCRSLMAQAIFAAEIKRRELVVKVLSAGLYNFEGVLAAREAKLCCERHGTPLLNYVSTYFRDVDLSCATRIFVMTKEHVDLLVGAIPALSDRIALLGTFDPKQRGDELEDPIGKDSAAFDLCYERLRDSIHQYISSTNELV